MIPESIHATWPYILAHTNTKVVDYAYYFNRATHVNYVSVLVDIFLRVGTANVHLLTLRTSFAIFCAMPN